MKEPHNYISSLPPQEQKRLFDWYTISVYLCIGLIIILTFITLHHYLTIKNLQATHQTIQFSLQKLQQETSIQGQLQQEYERLIARTGKIEKLQNKQNVNLLTYLQETTAAIPDNVCLTEFSCSKKEKTALQGYAYSAQSAIAFLTSLQQIPHLKQLGLVSLSPFVSHETGKTWYQFHIKKV